MKVTKFEKIERFRDFSLTKIRNNHSVCTFSFASAKFDGFSDLIGNNVEVSDGNNTLMYAYVSDVAFVLGNTENLVEVTLVSRSKNVDLDTSTRVFQKENQTYKDILNEVIQKMNYELNVPVSLSEAKLEHPIVQTDETDFIFVKRLVQEAYGREIVVDAENDNKIFVGYIDSSKYAIKQNEIFTISQKMSMEDKTIEFTIKGDSEGQELREFVNIGKQISWQGDTFVINRIEIVKTEDVYRYKCYAIGDRLLDGKAENKCATFVAKVIDVDDPENLGRVRLDFSNDDIEDMSPEGKMWCNVLTPYTAKSGGFVFIPDVDDIVETIWNGSEFIIIGCIRQEQLAERYQDVKLKQIGNIHEKNVCFSEENIEITSKEVILTIFDEETHITIGNSDISILKDKIDIRTKKSAIEISDDIVADTCILHVDSDELEHKVKKSYTCESKNINLNASGSAVIEGKTKVSIN